MSSYDDDPHDPEQDASSDPEQRAEAEPPAEPSGLDDTQPLSGAPY
ncbi:MAG: hypothetical protein HOQ22_06150, partial [Nocardioidaceae bacterium]|nr:hypothetical protein [Nocardioidaceae bacterium]